MANLIFLNALRDKLKGGNTKSIHLNALPGRYATRLDIANLNYIKPKLAESFLELLFSKSCFEFKISFDEIDISSLSIDEHKRLGLLSKRLNSLNIENEDNYKEHGIKTFSFGFPLLIMPSKSDPKKIIKAPLFIWPLELIKSTNKINTWSILRNKTKNETGKIVDEEIHSVGLNEVLLSFLKNDKDVIIPQINEDLLEDAIIDKKELIDECLKVLSILNPHSSNSFDNLTKKLNENIENIPEAKTLESYANNLGSIYFGGVFGLFRAQKESIITDIDKLIENFNSFEFEDLKIEGFSGTPHSAVETDPSQQELLNTIGLDTKKIIQGPPGTGKSQSLTALITNALANNLKCLVVCEKKTALDVIKNNLHGENAQLGELAAIIEDLNKDRDGIVNSVRERIKILQQGLSYFNSTNYISINQEITQNINEINSSHKYLDEKIYKGKNWTELVGEFLNREKIADPTLLKNKLDHNQFKFDKDENELINIISNLKKGKQLFSEIKNKQHPLNILDDSIFLEENPRAVVLKLENNVLTANKKFVALLEETNSDIDEYCKWLDSHFNEYSISIKNGIDDYISFIETNKIEYGEIFLSDNSFTNIKVNLLSVFSKRYKTLKTNKLLILNKISDVKERHLKHNYFSHDYIEINKSNSLVDYVENINKLKDSFLIWSENIEEFKNNYKLNINFESIHFNYDKSDNINKTEKKYKQILEYFESNKILKNSISLKPKHNEKRIQIEGLLNDLKIVTDNLNSFREYYDWRKFYIQLTNLHKKIINSLIDLNETEWEPTFESWYYYWLLALNEKEQLPKNDYKILELYEAKSQLKGNQIESIINNWSKKQSNSIRKAQSIGLNPISLFNKKGAPGQRRNSLRKIVNTDFDLFTDFYPVVMISPSVCSSILPLVEGLFDVVIFDEASQLRIEDTYPALIRGKIKIVSGDSQQMPPTNFFQGGNALLSPNEYDYDEEQSSQEIQDSIQKVNNSLELADSESLLVYAENNNYKQSYLKVHYRSQHPSLIEFSNHAFYGKRLIPMPAKIEYKPIQYIEVNGVYEDSVNRDEAKQVINILLNHIKPLKNGKYPSVGVATFNLYQRNLILEEISKARQLKPEYDKKIADLGSDLFVKNLENIQGDERDIIIISTTFGKKTDGTFRQLFGPILQKNGFKLLNVIITRAKYKVYLCTSIPPEHINQYSSLLQEFKNNGRAIFYSYLAYAKAISEGNIETKELILKQLYENCDTKSFDIEYGTLGSESPFEDEVYYRLANRIGQDRIQQQYKIGGFRIDLVVKSKLTGKPFIAVECDGAKYHSSNEAYAWDMFRQDRLELQGFKFHRIWSTNWFNYPEKELTKLVDFIHKNDLEERNEITSSINDNIFEEEKIDLNFSIPENLKTTLFD
ncbi:AAA domain-containing protein [Flavobacterium koreense]